MGQLLVDEVQALSRVLWAVWNPWQAGGKSTEDSAVCEVSPWSFNMTAMFLVTWKLDMKRQHCTVFPDGGIYKSGIKIMRLQQVLKHYLESNDHT